MTLLHNFTENALFCNVVVIIIKIKDDFNENIFCSTLVVSINFTYTYTLAYVMFHFGI